MSDTKVYRDVSNTENILSKLSETSNRMFSSLKRRGFLTEKQMKYFTYEFKKATNFGKLHLLPKIHKRLHNVPGRPVISNCGSPTEKCSEFLDHHLLLREALDKQDKKCIPTEDLIKMAEFVLKNNFFEFNDKIKQQVSGTTIGTKFAPPYACLFMDKFETRFLETQQLQLLVWFRYIDHIFSLYGRMVRKNLKFF